MNTVSSSPLPDPGVLTQELRLALPHFTHVDWKVETASTNLDLRDFAHPQAPPRPWLQGAHLQTQGRGRAGRAWQNRPGACLMFSCAFDVRLAAERLSMLSPLSGMGACRALRALLAPGMRHDLDLKWPNDVQWRGAKLSGILVETTRVAGTGNPIVIMGMGLNVQDAPAISRALGRDVADWSQIARVDSHAAAIALWRIVADIARAWEADIACLHDSGTAAFPEQYREVDALVGKTVHIMDRGALVQTGMACGVNEDGQLLVRSGNGDVTAVTVGEVSVRAS